MVDINLMGDRESSEDRQREENFAKTVNLDEPQTTSQTKDSSFTRETFGTSYQNDTTAGSFSKRPTDLYESGSSRTKAYLIVLGLILAALTAVFFMIPKDDQQQPDSIVENSNLDDFEQETPSQESSGSETLDDPVVDSQSDPAMQMDDTMPPAESSMPEDEPEEDISASTDWASTLTAAERELVASTRLGAYTVNALAKTLSAPNDFTLITYHGNHKFFVEFLSSSSTETSNLTEMIQSSVSPVDMKTVSQSDILSNGTSVRKVLVSGQMDEQAGLVGFGGSINRMTREQFSGWIQQLAQENGVRIKRYIAGSATGDRTPIQVHVAGPKANVMAFITALSDANPSIAVAKLIVSPSDRRTLSSENLDLVMHVGLVEML